MPTKILLLLRCNIKVNVHLDINIPQKMTKIRIYVGSLFTFLRWHHTKIGISSRLQKKLAHVSCHFFQASLHFTHQNRYVQPAGAGVGIGFT